MQSRWSRFSKFALAGTVSILLASFFPSPFPEELSSDVAALTTKSESALGVYDPDRAFDRSEDVLIEHHFVTWRPDNADELIVALDRAKQANRLPMITLESWPWEWNGMGRETLLQDIVAGKYDPTLRRIFQVIQQQSPQPILIRWGHEMEIVGQYPWSTDNPKAYIAAYRYIVDFARETGTDNLVWVWSPAGNKTAQKYWPGKSYVDAIGISIYANKAWNYKNQQKVPSFKQLLLEKYWLVKRYQEPLIAAEVGVAGTKAEKEQWIADAMQTLPSFTEIKAWIYFNQVQPDIVPLPIGQPHWELDRDRIALLLHHWQKISNRSLSPQTIDEYFSQESSHSPASKQSKR